MSDTKNHQKAIKAIIEAHRTPGKMREIMLTILADKPSAIVNAWEEISRGSELITCQGCFCITAANELFNNNNTCGHCGAKLILSP